MWTFQFMLWQEFLCFPLVNQGQPSKELISQHDFQMWQDDSYLSNKWLQSLRHHMTASISDRKWDYNKRHVCRKHTLIRLHVLRDAVLAANHQFRPSFGSRYTQWRIWYIRSTSVWINHCRGQLAQRQGWEVKREPFWISCAQITTFTW